MLGHPRGVAASLGATETWADLGGLLEGEGEEGADFPGPGPHAWGRIIGRVDAPPGQDVRVNDHARPGQLAGCTVQSETSVAGMGPFVYVGFNDAQQCRDAVSPSPSGPISWTGFAISRNSGKSFQDVGPLQGNGPIVDLFGDPVLALDTRGRSKGTLYLASLANSEKGSTIAVGTSADRGNTFAWHDAGAALTTGSAFQDKEWLAVDNTGGPADGTVYLTWTSFGSQTAIVFTRSTDGGKTWSDPKPVATGNYQGSRPLVGPNGEITSFSRKVSARSRRVEARYLS